MPPSCLLLDLGEQTLFLPLIMSRTLRPARVKMWPTRLAGQACVPRHGFRGSGMCVLSAHYGPRKKGQSLVNLMLTLLTGFLLLHVLS